MSRTIRATLVNRIENDIKPPLGSAISIPLAVKDSAGEQIRGLCVYVAQSAFVPEPIHIRDLQRIAKAIAQSIEGVEIDDIAIQ